MRAERATETHNREWKCVNVSCLVSLSLSLLLLIDRDGQQQQQ